MQSWHTTDIDVAPHTPQILSTTAQTRAILLHLPAGERLREHQVKERAWVLVVAGEIEFSATTGGELVVGGEGLLVELEAGERHEVVARTDARLLILLAPWPAKDHAGTMTLQEKHDVRAHAAERAGKETL